MKYITVILTLYFAAVVFGTMRGQSDKVVDSLLQVVNVAGADLHKVDVLNNLGYELLNRSRYQEAKNSLDRAIDLGKELHYQEGLSTALHYYGRVCQLEGDYAEALKKYEAAFSIRKELGNEIEMAKSYNGIGLVYWEMGNYEEALSNHEASLAIKMKLDDSLGMIKSFLNIGIVQDMLGNYTEGLRNFLTALKIAEFKGDTSTLGACYTNIGMIYSYQGNYQESLNSHQEALRIAEAQGIKSEVAFALNNVGLTLKNLGRYQEALSHAMKAVSIASEINYKAGIAAGLSHIGEVYLVQNNPGEALEHFLSSLRMYEEMGSQDDVLIQCLNIGNAYHNQGNYQEAKKSYSRALEIGKAIKSRANTGNAYFYLSQVNEALGDYRDALRYYKYYSQTNDSLLNETSRKELTYLKEQFESEKKDREIALLNHEKTIQSLEADKQRQTKNYLLIGLAIFVFLAIQFYKSYKARQELKLMTLRNKIASDLHDDIGSTLSSISIFSQMAQGQSGEAQTALRTISESSRTMLDAMADIVWTINPENDQFEKIIMRMRGFAYELLSAKQIEFDFDADEQVSNLRLSMEARKNLYLIFKEAVNNLVKYAEADKARLAITEENDKLTMLIRDNGKGFDTTREMQGNGLKNMKKRAREIGAQLWIDSLPGSGTTIKLELAV